MKLSNLDACYPSRHVVMVSLIFSNFFIWHINPPNSKIFHQFLFVFFFEIAAEASQVFTVASFLFGSSLIIFTVLLFSLGKKKKIGCEKSFSSVWLDDVSIDVITAIWMPVYWVKLKTCPHSWIMHTTSIHTRRTLRRRLKTFIRCLSMRPLFPTAGYGSWFNKALFK